MANARPGGPRRPAMDYYEFKRLHEQRARQAGALNERATPEEADQTPAKQAPYREKETRPETPVQPAPTVQEEPDQTADKPSLFGGVKALMKGVTSRLPADEPEVEEEPEVLDIPEDDGEPAAPEGEPEALDEAPGDEDLTQDDEDVLPDDAPQIDNPIGDAIHKVVGLFQTVRSKIAKRAPGAETEDPEDEDEMFAAPADEESDAETRTSENAGEEAAPALSRRMRKAMKAQEPEAESHEPPILDIRPVDAEEVEELVSKPGTTVHAGFEEDAPKARPAPADEPDEDDVDDEDDDLPATRGTRLFGFFSKFKGRSTAADEDASEPDQLDGEDEPMQEEQRAALTERLAEELDSAPVLSRRERKALAAGKGKPASQVSAAPAQVASPAASAPVVSDVPAATMPFTTPTASRPAFTADEPTQEFRPLRARVAPPAPVPEEDEYDDEDDDLTPARRAPKPVKEKKRRRVYKDEDLEDEEEEDRYDDDRYDDDRYDDDPYDDYDGYDDYDDYDDYDEEDDRFDDEYYISPGRRFLGFLKGLIVFVLFLALCVLALRQLEASRMISLNGLRQTVGQIVPIDIILPSPAPEVMAPEATPEPEPTAEITQEEPAATEEPEALEDEAAPEDEAAEDETAADEADSQLPPSSENP